MVQADRKIRQRNIQTLPTPGDAFPDRILLDPIASC